MLSNFDNQIAIIGAGGQFLSPTASIFSGTEQVVGDNLSTTLGLNREIAVTNRLEEAAKNPIGYIRQQKEYLKTQLLEIAKKAKKDYDELIAAGYAPSKAQEIVMAMVRVSYTAGSLMADAKYPFKVEDIAERISKMIGKPTATVVPALPAGQADADQPE